VGDDFPGSSLRRWNNLFVSNPPDDIIDCHITKRSRDDRNFEQATFGFNDRTAVSTDARDYRSWTVSILVKRTATSDSKPGSHDRG
jgi:hypothetical protein